MGQGRNKGDLKLFSSKESAVWWGWQCEEKKNGDKAASRGRENSGLSYWIQEWAGKRIHTVGKCCIWNQKGHFPKLRRGGQGLSGHAEKPKLWLYSSHKLLNLHTLSLHANSCQHSHTHTCTQTTHSHKNVVLDKVPVNSKNKSHSNKRGINWDPHQRQSGTKPCLGRVLCLGLWCLGQTAVKTWWCSDGPNQMPSAAMSDLLSVSDEWVRAVDHEPKKWGWCLQNMNNRWTGRHLQYTVYIVRWSQC